MVRSMYAGVSGMKAHQGRMDVIGNNIANVNTNGFKGSRATFRDVYYQTLKGASGASASAGGRNVSQVGYGAQLGSIDIQMARTGFQMTDNSMDLAIDGDGFFQVQDSDGNRYYTRAGALLFDSAGNLVDGQGNFVLGVSGNPLGQAPSSDKIQMQIPPVPPKQGNMETKINGQDFKIQAQNNSKDGNVSLQYIVGQNMTDGVKCVANVGTSGIVITVNPNETFATIDEFNTEVNKAITAYTMQTNGKPHPAGDFTISTTAGTWPLKGEEICSTDFAVQQGKTTGWPDSTTIAGGIKPNGTTGTGYSAAGAMTGFDVSFDATAGAEKWVVTAVIGGVTYTGEVGKDRNAKGTFQLKNLAGTADDYIVFDRPSYETMNKAVPGNTTGAAPATGTKLSAAEITAEVLNKVTTTAAQKSKALGLSSKNMILTGGTEGGPQTLNDLSGISIGPDGVITAQHAVLGDLTVGRLDLVNFANPSGLQQSGGTYFTTSANSGQVTFCQPGTDGAGALVGGALELSNVDLSREFADMITTQRGFQANSRLITVSDQILEELVNLKR